jgi:hypothetical protein
MFPVQLRPFFPRFVPSVPGCCTFLLSFLLALTLPLSVRAQDGTQAPYPQADGTYPPEVPAAAAPAHVSLVDGAATVERDGQSQPATVNAPFVPGDRLRTTTGRAELIFADGSVLDVDQYSAVDLQAPALIRLASGRVMLFVSGAGNQASSAARYQIDTPVASARADGPGEYRIAVVNGRNGLEAELAVLRGTGSLATERGAGPVRAGERSIARDAEAPSYPQGFNSARFDAFDQWAMARRDERIGSVSPQYLPPDLQMYGGTFDRYGSWEYSSPYGNVWYPTVAPDWRPYYYGSWAPYQPWGWTWIGLDYWAWPTHHFGRWGFARSRWFWIPGRTWSPAWVEWAGAPGFVSWCPLGFNGRPVFAFSLGFASRWNGWTVLPRGSFEGFRRVDRFAVAPHLVPTSTPFVVGHRAPVAIPRTAHAQNVTVPPGAGGARPRFNEGSNQGFNQGFRPQGNTAISSGVNAQDTRAVPRAGVTPPSAVGHQLKQPLPDGFRTPAYTGAPQRGVYQVGPHVNASGTVPQAVPRTAPRTVPQGVPRTAPQTVPQGVPRASAPVQRSVPQPAGPIQRAVPRSYEPQPRQYEPRAYQPGYQPQRSYQAPAYQAPAYQPRPYQTPPRVEPAPPAHMPSMPAPRTAPAPMAGPRSSGSYAAPSGGSHAAPSGGGHSAPSGAPSGGGAHASHANGGSSGGGHRR